MTALQTVLDQAIRNVTFRERILQDAAGTLAPFGLSAADQDRVLQHVEMLTSGEEEEAGVNLAEAGAPADATEQPRSS